MKTKTINQNAKESALSLKYDCVKSSSGCYSKYKINNCPRCKGKIRIPVRDRHDTVECTHCSLVFVVFEGEIEFNSEMKNNKDRSRTTWEYDKIFEKPEQTSMPVKASERKTPPKTPKRKTPKSNEEPVTSFLVHLVWVSVLMLFLFALFST